jgi:RNA polymerase sigma factor for flagellar operon FliA
MDVDRASDRLATHHLALARRAAAVVHRRVRRHVALDELIAQGNAGLVEAARRYDPGRGVAFPAYAWSRVLGAVLDGVRRSAPLPRRAWSQLAAASAELAAARAAGDPRTRVAHAMSAIRTLYVTSLEALRERGFDAAADAPAPPDRLDACRSRRRLAAAVAALPAKQRALITKHYWEGKQLTCAARELGLSKSWASRLHAQAVAKLREAVAEA